jgi:hypothetical protein
MPVGLVVVSVPPQVEADAEATVRPAGSVSVKATPVSATELAAGSVMVKVSELVAPVAMLAGLNDLAMVGGATTARLAEAVPPVPPSVEVTEPVVLFLVPGVLPVTLTENVQLEVAARVAPDRETELEPATEVMVPPPHDPIRPLGVLTTRPAGSVSV